MTAGEYCPNCQAPLGAVCADCGASIPQGQGIAHSVFEEEWTDRSKSRGLTLIPLCWACVMERIGQKL